MDPDLNFDLFVVAKDSSPRVRGERVKHFSTVEAAWNALFDSRYGRPDLVFIESSIADVLRLARFTRNLSANERTAGIIVWLGKRCEPA